MKKCKIYFPIANQVAICDLNLIAIETEIEAYCKDNDCIIDPSDTLDINFIDELIKEGHAHLGVVYDENTGNDIIFHIIKNSA